MPRKKSVRTLGLASKRPPEWMPSAHPPAMGFAGFYRFEGRRVACRNAYCTVCRAPRLAEGHRLLVVFHVFFIPLLPIWYTMLWRCRTCENDTTSNMPGTPSVLIGRALLMLGFSVVSGAMAIWMRAYLLLGAFAIAGLAMAIGFLATLRRPQYRRYLDAERSVTPLNPGVCPVCRAVLAPRAVPRCGTCRIDVIVSKNR
jgi:hypothetical protein